jgi:hypothetical protein
MSTIKGHFWIENDKEEVVYDPTFPEHEIIKRLNGCNNTPCYRKESTDIQRDMMAECIIPKLLKLKKIWGDKAFLEANRLSPKFQRCSTNVVLYKLAGGKGKIVYGDMGWKKSNPERNYYEWEHRF